MGTLLLNALKSKTIIGIILTAIGATSLGGDVVSSFGLTEDSVVTYVDVVIQTIGTLLAVYGRAVAKNPLTK